MAHHYAGRDGHYVWERRMVPCRMCAGDTALAHCEDCPDCNAAGEYEDEVTLAGPLPDLLACAAACVSLGVALELDEEEQAELYALEAEARARRDSTPTLPVLTKALHVEAEDLSDVTQPMRASWIEQIARAS